MEPWQRLGRPDGPILSHMLQPSQTLCIRGTSCRTWLDQPENLPISEERKHYLTLFLFYRLFLIFKSRILYLLFIKYRKMKKRRHYLTNFELLEFKIELFPVKNVGKWRQLYLSRVSASSGGLVLPESNNTWNLRWTVGPGEESGFGETVSTKM